MTKFLKRPISILLAVLMIAGIFTALPLTAYAAPTETLLTTITATGKEQANYSTANVATVSFSYTAGGSSAYLANWGWWGYGWTATVNAAEGYTITKCVFYDDANRTATDSSSPFVVETTEEDKTPQVNGTPILAYTSKGIKKIEVYGYATPTTYTVTWKNGDTVLETDENVAEGTTPEYNGNTPVKAEDENYTYTFSGWTNGTNTYGKDETLPAVTANVIYTATFESVKRSYTITWKNEDGSVIDTTTVEYGETPTHADPEKAATAQYNYTFLGWSPAVTAVTGNAEYTATFSSTVNDYTVTWKNGDDVLKTDTVAYGETPVYKGATPTKAEDEKYTYTFAGWSPEVTAVTGDVTYTATFDAVRKTIKYDDEHTLNPNDRIAVSDEDEGKKKFDLHLNQYLNMQMLGIQKKSAIATQGGDDGIRFVTAVNSKLLQGSNIDDYGYIVVKAKESTSVADIYSKMDNLTYDKVAYSPKNFFSCYGSDNTISGDFGKFSTNTDYKYVTLSLTNTSGSTDTVAARFYVKTKDNKFYYADYIDGNNQKHGGMAFKLPIESNSLV